VRSYLNEKVAAQVYKTEVNGQCEAVVLTTRHPSIRKKLALSWPTNDGRSVGIVRLLTKVHGVNLKTVG
jgi:hypothetical protein